MIGAIPTLNLATLRHHTTAQSFTRGESYYQAGAVVALTQRGQRLQAEVEGSEAMPYHVTVTFDAKSITTAHCTCPYSFEGWCKHIVAVLLTCIHQPDTIAVRPSLEELLAQLDLNQMRQVCRTLLAEHPHLIDDLDRQVSLITAAPPTTTGAIAPTPMLRRTPVDPAPFQRQVRQVFRNAVNAWESGYDDDPVNDDLLEIIAKAEEFAARGDGENAIAILTSITQGCVDHWDEADDYGADSDEIVTALDTAWTAAILTLDFATSITGTQRQQLRSQLQTWQQQWQQELPMALTALQQGWHDPPLQRVLHGEITELGAWDGAAPDFADDLAQIRLRILDRQQRHQEYLYLAEAEGQTEPYLTMLARLGRIDEAMAAAPTQMTKLEEAFALAQILQQQGARESALAVAQIGLTLPGQRLYDLATWTSDLAADLGDLPISVAAKVTAFKTKPSFDDYQQVAALAGADWATQRKDLLQTLRNRTAGHIDTAKVDIFLYEGLIDSAITAVQDLGYYAAPLIHRVMDAAIAQRPDWVIENARQRAEEIMTEGRSKAYRPAAEWLAKVKAAYYQAGRQAEWAVYHRQLLQTHARKYSLMALLQKL